MEGSAARTSFLLCRRASRLNKHCRAVGALPGGRLDDGETVVDAALSELHEEIGVELDARRCSASSMTTRHGRDMSCTVVLWADEHVSLIPNPDEVRAVYRIGLSELCRQDSPRFVEIPESDRPVVQLPLGSFLLHAPTAAVMLQFRWVGLDGHHGRRVDDLEQPVFAWK